MRPAVVTCYALAAAGGVIGIGCALWWSWQLSLWLLGGLAVAFVSLLGWLAGLDMRQAT